MNITVLRETEAGEARVALMPDSVQKLIAQKASVSIESGAGLGAARTDDDYREAGATVSPMIEMLCSPQPTSWSRSIDPPEKISIN